MTISVSQSNMASAPVSNNTKNPDLKEEATLKPNTLKNKMMSGYQRTTSAFTEYPAKGLTGSKKANFYEFLTMGTVPYLVGSATLIALFNTVKGFDNTASKFAKKYGNKMALGVVFYGIAKTLSKSLISTPVKWATGIDTEMAYERHVYSDPKQTAELGLKHPINEYEQHKVMESHDFPRYDVMYGDKEGKPHNYRFDKIAKKNGLGEDLPASDTEVKPIIKDVISRSNTAKSISSYLWAAVGVGLATQNSWNKFFRAASKQNWDKFKPSSPDANFIQNAAGRTINTAKNIWRITESFGRNFVKASKELYHGPAGETGFNKHAGKALLATAAITTVLGVANTIYGARTAVGQNKNVFDKNEKVTVQ